MCESLVFRQRQVAGLSLLSVDSWLQDGLAHGFADAALDVSAGTKEWDAVSADLRLNAGKELLLLNQIHGTKLCVWTDNKSLVAPGEYWSRDFNTCGFNNCDADGWVIDRRDSGEKNYSFGIRTADCVPVILCSSERKVLAVLHCGWRGAVKGLLSRCLNQFSAFGVSPEEIEVAIGPGAGLCCFEVSEDVAKYFYEFSPEKNSDLDVSEAGLELVSQREGKIFCNIQGLLKMQALGVGISSKKVFSVDTCTICNKRYFSYRRQKELSGRQLSFIS